VTCGKLLLNAGCPWLIPSPDVGVSEGEAGTEELTAPVTEDETS
jgi:hypothetical protein